MAAGEGREEDAATAGDAESAGDAGGETDAVGVEPDAAGTDIVAGGGYPAACDTAARRLLYDLVSIPSPVG